MFAIKEKIHTIPVSDALNNGGECAFCAMHNSLEERAIDFMLGSSVAYMEDYIRLKTDEIGFCARHYQLMYAFPNRLGLALSLSTHFMKLNESLIKACKDVNLKKKENKKLTDYLKRVTESCYICDRINATFDEYVGTFFYLWEREPEIRQAVENGCGYCIPHFAMLVERAGRELSKPAFADFYAALSGVQTKNMLRVQDELDWFTKKFDYRYADEPWKNSRDSIVRGIQKLASVTLEDNK